MFRNIEVALTTNVAGFRRDFAAHGATVRTFVSQTQVASANASDGLRTVGMAAVGMAAAVGVAFGVAGKAAADFDADMRNVSSLTQDGAAGLARMRQEVLALSTEVPKSAGDLGKGLYEVASAGYAGADATMVLTESSKSAVAGLSSTDDAAKAIMGTLHAYGLGASEAAHVSDVWFETVKNGIVTFPQLTQEIGQFIGMAAVAGADLEEVGAAFATITLAGVPAGETGTLMERAFLSLMNPTESLTEMVHQLGFESSEAMLHQLGFAKSIQTINAAAAGSGTKLKDLTGDIRSTRAFLALGADDGKLFAGQLDKVGQETTGARDRALAVQMQSAKMQLQLAWNAVMRQAIEMGTALLPVFRGIATWVKLVADTFGHLPGPVKFTAALFVGLLGVSLALGGAWLLLQRPMAGVVALLGAITGTAPAAAAGLTGVAAAETAVAAASGRTTTGLAAAAGGLGRLGTAVGLAGKALGALGVALLVKSVIDELAPSVARAAADLQATVALGGVDPAAEFDRRIAALKNPSNAERFTGTVSWLFKHPMTAINKYPNPADTKPLDLFRDLAKQAPDTAQAVIDSWRRQGRATAAYQKALDEVRRTAGSTTNAMSELSIAQDRQAKEAERAARMAARYMDTLKGLEILDTFGVTAAYAEAQKAEEDYADAIRRRGGVVATTLAESVKARRAVLDEAKARQDVLHAQIELNKARKDGASALHIGDKELALDEAKVKLDEVTGGKSKDDKTEVGLTTFAEQLEAQIAKSQRLQQNLRELQLDPDAQAEILKAPDADKLVEQLVGTTPEERRRVIDSLGTIATMGSDLYKANFEQGLLQARDRAGEHSRDLVERISTELGRIPGIVGANAEAIKSVATAFGIEVSVTPLGAVPKPLPALAPISSETGLEGGPVEAWPSGPKGAGLVAGDYKPALPKAAAPPPTSIGTSAMPGGFGSIPHKPFAAGGLAGIEDHRPQIANGYRLFGEPETGGEAYIPLGAAKRGASLALWRQVGGLLGAPEMSKMPVHRFGNGGIGGYQIAERMGASTPQVRVEVVHVPVPERKVETVHIEEQKVYGLSLEDANREARRMARDQNLVGSP